MGYLLGSLPTAYIIGRVKKVNIFEVGSGNMGGTNVARALGFKWGLLVGILDGLKGIIAIVIASQLIMPDNRPLASAIAALAAVVGHNWSLIVALLTGSLRGGKGAATAFGTMLVIAPFQVIAAMCVVGALLITLTRYVSLGVLVMFSLAGVWMLILISQQTIPAEYALYSWALLALILWRFRGNIQRLLAGTERRLGERASGG